eukprot:521168-Rhodomonas_salina.1
MRACTSTKSFGKSVQVHLFQRPVAGEEGSEFYGPFAPDAVTTKFSSVPNTTQGAHRHMAYLLFRRLSTSSTGSVFPRSGVSAFARCFAPSSCM